MNVNGKHYRTVWVKKNQNAVIQIIDQRYLPHEFVIEDLQSVDDVALAIKDMHVRGAGLIGATAGYGMYLAALVAPTSSLDLFNSFMINAGDTLKSTRPTAVNLAWAVDTQLQAMQKAVTIDKKIETAFITANKIADDDVEYCKRIGMHGLKIIQKLSKKKTVSR